MARRKFDAYYTPEFATKHLLEYIDIKNKKILEPCAGEKNISKVLYKETNNIINNDIVYENNWNYDATKEELFKTANETQKLDWIITNPPFNCAIDILKHSLTNSDNVAFLLRLSFLEPTYDRQELLSIYPPNKILVLPRISFTGDGKTDSVTCAWLIWDKSSETLIKVIPKK
jgi:hypothetical protein